MTQQRKKAKGGPKYHSHEKTEGLSTTALRKAKKHVAAQEELAWLINEGRVKIKFAKNMSARQRKKYALDKPTEVT